MIGDEPSTKMLQTHPSNKNWFFGGNHPQKIPTQIRPTQGRLSKKYEKKTNKAKTTQRVKCRGQVKNCPSKMIKSPWFGHKNDATKMVAYLEITILHTLRGGERRF